MTVYLLSKRGTLHRAEKTDAGLLTYEADNLDTATVRTYGTLVMVPPKDIKRMCRRCIGEPQPA